MEKTSWAWRSVREIMAIVYGIRIESGGCQSDRFGGGGDLNGIATEWYTGRKRR